MRLDTLDSERTETEVERACREVVESVQGDGGGAERAGRGEEWKQASARAERFSGQKAFIKTENDRLKVIIRREVGEHVDTGRLDDEIAATGGKKGRAATIRDLNMRLELLKMQLAEANDAPPSPPAPDLDSVPTLEWGEGGGSPGNASSGRARRRTENTRSERNGKRERTIGTRPRARRAPPPPRGRVVSRRRREMSKRRGRSWRRSARMQRCWRR